MRENKIRALPSRAEHGPLCSVPCFKGDVVARLRRGLPDEEDLEQARRLFAALADRHRLRILSTLKRREELSVCDVAHVLGVGVSVASHHLRRLRELGILKDRDDGKRLYYSLRRPSVAEIISRVLGKAA